jgi:hypothetical protein
MRAADLVVGRAKKRIQAKAFSVSLAGSPTKPLTRAVSPPSFTMLQAQGSSFEGAVNEFPNRCTGQY